MTTAKVKELEFKGYAQVPDTTEDEGKMWNFLFDKVIELRSERSRKSILPKTMHTAKTSMCVSKEIFNQ